MPEVSVRRFVRVSITERPDGSIFIEKHDPVLGVDEVAKMVGFTASTVRGMARKKLLHPLKSKGLSGSLRFRKSRLLADLKRIEDL